MRSKHLPGLPVLTLDRGATIGHVRQCVIDPEGKRVAALLVALPRLWSRRLLPMESVHALGSHAVTVSSADVLIPFKEDQNLAILLYEKRIPLLGSPVVTAAGELVGTVRDYEIDGTGAISCLYVMDGVWKALSGKEARVPQSALIALGKDAVIVTEETLVRVVKEREREAPPAPSAEATGEAAPWRTVAGRVRKRLVCEGATPTADREDGE